MRKLDSDQSLAMSPPFLSLAKILLSGLLPYSYQDMFNSVSPFSFHPWKKRANSVKHFDNSIEYKLDVWSSDALSYKPSSFILHGFF